jgi:hypothetical protein
MPKTVTVNQTKPLKVSVPIPKASTRIANLGDYAHPPKKGKAKKK